MTPEQRRTMRIASAQEVLRGYSLVRYHLTDAEKVPFDKAIQLLEELAEIPESKKLLALDSGIVAGLLAVSAPTPICDAIIHDLSTLVQRLSLISILGGLGGRRYSN